MKKSYLITYDKKCCGIYETHLKTKLKLPRIARGSGIDLREELISFQRVLEQSICCPDQH